MLLTMRETYVDRNPKSHKVLGIAPVAIIDRQLPFEYTITSRSTDVVVMTQPIQNIKYSAFRSMSERENLSGNNFNDWFRQLKLVLRVEKKMFVIEQPLPAAPAADSEAQVLSQWNAVYDAYNEVACLILGSMTPEIHRQFKNSAPYDMIKELKSMFEKQARVERFDLIHTFYACKQEDGKLVTEYVLKMKGYLEQLERLGYVLPQDLSVGLIFNGLISDFAGFLTPPYTPQHNGVSERRNRTLLDMVRSMMNLTTLPLSFWDYALESATRILNMVPTKKVDKTPYELWYGKVPNLSYLKVWGCEALMKRDTPDKLQQRSFFEKNLITQEVSGRAIHLEEIQDEDTSSFEITSKIPMEVEGFEPPQEEVIPIREVPMGILCKMESIRSRFFHGINKDGNKAVWVNWNNVLVAKVKGGLGVSSLYALNRALLFKWIWRFTTYKSSLWARVITAIHGIEGNIGSHSKKFRYKSLWRDIVSGMEDIKKQGADLRSFIHKKIGNGSNTNFWEDYWNGFSPLNIQYPRLFALETDKQIKVADKLNHPNLFFSFRRDPRGGAEASQLGNLTSQLEGVTLGISSDIWVWSLVGTGEFSVASVRKLVDDIRLPEVSSQSRWIKEVSIKVNVLSWKVRLDGLPTRLNISRRGIDIPSILCPICDCEVESVSHLFFKCHVATDIFKKICRWWNVDFVDIKSYDDWFSWLLNLNLRGKIKNLLEGVPFFLKLSKQTKKRVAIRYCFRAVIDDDGIATITCFSPETHTFAPDCNEVGARPEDPDFTLDAHLIPSSATTATTTTVSKNDPWRYTYINNELSLQGFAQMVTNTWNSIILDDRNGVIRFKKKLQILKKEIKVWIADFKKKQSSHVNNNKDKLRVIDNNLDQGGVSDELLLSQLNLMKQLQDIKTAKACDFM
ncbi:RNA-directed DNA polymerase, eukaryota, reverse transcriptase zinc-binding domain protein [Tanacetum coccineum]